ncbi:hypothetical protein ALO_00175 [Acetonema longum DSM 6540]|uniref:Uncharacterized protein n=1 Tax=Acetonema longum DSM 6540 TaxID=1009370 RepID=F7NDC8_9FIRM|nr:hypothetical protein ALO_00175 [Acetonema longum DSM 6540]
MLIPLFRGNRHRHVPGNKVACLAAILAACI